MNYTTKIALLCVALCGVVGINAAQQTMDNGCECFSAAGKEVWVTMRAMAEKEVIARKFGVGWEQLNHNQRKTGRYQISPIEVSMFVAKNAGDLYMQAQEQIVEEKKNPGF